METANRDRHKMKNIHPAICIQMEGMDVKTRVLMFGARSKLWAEKENISKTVNMVERCDGLDIFIETRIAYELGFYNPADIKANKRLN
jgi:hypothetical protein